MLPHVALLLLASALAAEPARPGPRPSAAVEPPTLTVRELTVASQAAVVPTRQALALAGQRVRLVGFMARQEEPSAGGFWLAARPVECDEGGGGTADLPPGSVRVLLAGEPQAPIEGPIAVVGLLEVGNDLGRDGPASTFRLRIERPSTSPASTP